MWKYNIRLVVDWWWTKTQKQGHLLPLNDNEVIWNANNIKGISILVLIKNTVQSWIITLLHQSFKAQSNEHIQWNCQKKKLQ